MNAVATDRIWRALADRTRRELLDRLAERPHTTGELVASCPSLCRTAVMKHLDVLHDAELILVRREGRVRWNELNAMPIQRIYDRWVSRHVRASASALSRLKDRAESRGPARRRKSKRTEHHNPEETDDRTRN
jgi:DNA-binding transcriptional ArsR family regulator